LGKTPQAPPFGGLGKKWAWVGSNFSSSDCYDAIYLKDIDSSIWEKMAASSRLAGGIGKKNGLQFKSIAKKISEKIRNFFSSRV